MDLTMAGKETQLLLFHSKSTLVSSGYIVHGPDRPMFTAGKEAHHFLNAASHQWKSENPHREAVMDTSSMDLTGKCVRREKRHNICWTLLHSNDNLHWYIFHGPNRLMCTARKRGTTFVEHCFTQWQSTPISSHMDTSSMDLTGQCVWREKDAQHLLNAASQQWQSTL